MPERDKKERSYDDEPIVPRLSDFRVVFVDKNPNYRIEITDKVKTMEDFIPFITEATIYNWQHNHGLSSRARSYSCLFTFQGRAATGTTTLETMVADDITSLLISLSTSMPNMYELTFDIALEDYVVRKKFPPEALLEPADNTRLLKVSESHEQELAEWIVNTGGIAVINVPGATYATLRDNKGKPQLSIVERAFNPDFFYRLCNFETPFKGIRMKKFMHAFSGFVVAEPAVTMILGRYRELLKRSGDDLEHANQIQSAFNRPGFKNIIELKQAQEGAPMRHLLETEKAIRKVTWSILDYIWDRLPQAHLKIVQEDKRAAETHNDDYPQYERDSSIIELADMEMLAYATKVASFIARPNSANYQHVLADVIRASAYESAEIEIHKINGQFFRYGPGAAIIKVIFRNEIDLDLLQNNRVEINNLLEMNDLAS